MSPGRRLVSGAPVEAEPVLCLMPVQAPRRKGKTVLGIVTSVNYPPKKAGGCMPNLQAFHHSCTLLSGEGFMGEVSPSGPTTHFPMEISSLCTKHSITELWMGCAQCEPLVGSLRSFFGVWEMLEKQHRSGERSPPGTYLASDGHPLWDAPCQASWLKKLLSQL